MAENKKSRQRHGGHRLPTLVEHVQSILQKYPDGGQILKELIQNADDAGATAVSFFFDERSYGVTSLETPVLARFQGPALYCHNNATFKQQDWEGIRNLMKSNKKDDPLKIGRFGIGFNSVYHITDLPGIASGDTIAFLDPHEEYFKDEKDKGRGSSVTSYYFDEDLLQEKTRDQFMPFHDVFGCNLQDSEKYYEGTLFRFPLRTIASELSTEGYSKEKVLKLFDSLQMEASVVLLFLKNISSISLHKRSENGEIECTFKVEIAEDSQDEVTKRRKEFLDKAKTKSEISDSKYVMNIKVTDVSTTREYRWLVVNQIGSNVPRISELATKENLPPWVGMALPLDSESKSMCDGRIFCFLPLPPDVDCETGLPVHVHGAFALTDNRRGLVWPGADNQSSTAEWNKLLLLNVAVEVYSKLLHALLQNSPPIGIDERSRSQLVYSTLPCKAKGHWDVILHPLFQKLSKEEWKLFLAQHTSGNSWVRLQDAILDRLDDSNVRETVLRALLNCSETIITNIPNHVLKIVDNHFPASRDITPGLMRSVLKTQHDLKASLEDKIELLEYILEDDPSDDLKGVPLLPLANREFTTFVSNSYAEKPSSSIFIATETCPISVLPNFDYRFLSEDVPTTVKDKLQTLGSEDLSSTNATQLVLINKEIVLQHLRSCLPAEWFNNSHTIVQWMPENASHPSESWLEVIWSWINSNFPDSLDSFDGLPLIQLPDQAGTTYKQLGVLSKESCFIFASDVSGNSLPNVVVDLLTASGCTVVPCQSSNLRHLDINTYIATATPTGVMSVLSRTSLEKAQGFVELCSSDQRSQLREFLSRLPTSVDSIHDECKLLLRLPLFNTLDGSSAAIQNEDETASVAEPKFIFPDDVKFRRCKQIISSADTSSQQLLRLLDVKILNSAEVLVKFLFPDIAALNVYGLDETAKIMLWVITRVFEFTTQCDGFIEEMKHLPFVPTDEGMMVKPSELYDPGDPTLVNLFHGQPNKFPRHDYHNAHVVSLLRDQMGLRTVDNVSANELFEVATCISTSSRSSSSCKLQALVKILNDSPQYLDQSVNSGVTLKSELLRVKWLPHATTSQTVCPRFPQSMAWYACDAEYFSPPDLCDKSYALIVGSSMPILDINLSERVRGELGFTVDPPLKHVVAQLKTAITVWSNVNEKKVCALFKEMIVAIYNQLTRCQKEAVLAQLNNVSAEHWIWHGNGFCSPSQISFKMDIPSDLRPQLYLLPDELRDDAKLEQFFLESGVREKFSEDDIIAVLPVLKQKHETPDVEIADVEKDLKLCRSILEWFDGKCLSESMKENLLFPVESEENILVLKHYKDCAYCDADWLRREESELYIPDEHSIIHNSVPTKIAISLGVPKLSSCLLSAETLDFDLGIEKSGPNEPITKRIHNILEDYKEGVGVFKELIQNADDAGASKVRFLVDWRVGPKQKLLADGMSECQGPALWAYNDGVFSDNDFENINKLAGATKKQDISTIGRFGLGFNAVYHLTDVPSFISREYIVMFDPNCHHLQKHITDASQPGIRINLAKSPKPLKIFEDQFQPYHGVFDCNVKYNAQEPFHYQGTLFRLPFRTLVQAGKSDICQKVYDEEKVKAIVDSLTKNASLILLYTEHVSEVELFELNNNEKPEQMRPILSLKRTADTSGSGTPFIKTCSAWWSEKIRDESNLTERPSKSQCITINISESSISSSGHSGENTEHSQSQESWLINSCMGTGSSSDLALRSEGREKGLMPFAETAVKLKCEETAGKIPGAVSGEAFCFLPLSIPTGLPVHINGYFAIMSNRRAIWEPGTTEHDRPFESDWNASLLSDAIACSYIHLLLVIKSKLSVNAIESLQAILPCYDTLHSATWEPLVKSIYDKIVNESLAIFWCNEQWLDIHSGFILDDDLRNAPRVISTMNSLGKNVLDLTEDVCKSLKKAGHEDTIRGRTLTLERFFQELFFPKISGISHDLREPLVRFGLDCIVKGHEELEKLFRNKESILSDDGELKKPGELFDPNDSQLQDLFSQETGKFPHQDFVDNNSSFLPVLKKLGLRSKDMITPEELLTVAKNISLCEFSDLSIKKIQALVNILQSENQYLVKAVNGCSTLKQELRGVKWLPRARSPPEICRYPEKMPWLDVEDAFFSPAELRGKSQALLIGSCMPVVDIIPENLLGVISELPLENVVEQLSKAVHLSCTDPHMKSTSQFHDLVLAIYQYLADVSHDALSTALTKADLAHWIWHGAGFCSPSQISFTPMDIHFELRPQLFHLPEELKDDPKLEKFFLESGVREKFSEDDIIAVLPVLKQKHETPDVEIADVEKDLKLCRSILEWFDGKCLSESMKENLLFPVESEENILVLKHYKDCAYCDADWLRREESELYIPDEHSIIHNSVPTKIAITLGVPKLSACLLSAENLNFDLGIEKSGPNEPITTRIRNILDDYKEGVGVFKELIQNADDAGASKVRFLVDWRDGPKHRLLADGMSECQGPALWAYNDGVFSDNDFKNINKLAGATKKEDISTIGRFGLGFNAVYHLTDVPSFVSREYIVMFDPNCHHLHITDASQPGIRINLAKFPRPLKVFENQFQPYHGVFDCNMKYNAQEPFHYQGTLFRFPFRTLVQAGKSDICKKVYDEEKVKAIVDSLTESASLLLLYAEHVTEVELFELKSNQKPEQMRPILSVKKTADASGSGTPFIKTCSKWWNEKIRDESNLTAECPSKSQCITINVTKSSISSSGEIEHSKMKESWLINSCIGTGSSSALALRSDGREKGLMPFAETAAKLTCDETAAKIPGVVSGEAFCFLPLSIPTGLPVHINGYFAVMSNRRAIWEPGTTEHDKPFEGEWNASLLSDAIACSYIRLLLEIKRELSKSASKSLQEMLPSYDNLHSATWEPLVKSIYDKIVNESLAIFWCNEKWLDIQSGFILDDDLRNAPGVISTMNSLGENVLDLTEDVCKSFKKAGHEDTLQCRTLTLERFFQELFFPNISRISHDLREPLVRFGLDCILKGHEGLEKLFRENESILSDDGELKKPGELFDPNDSQLQDLFFQDPGKFPDKDFTANDSPLLSVLKRLGLRNKEMIMPEELLKVAKKISLSEFSDAMIKKGQALVNILQSENQHLSQAVSGCNTLKHELRDVKWLPRARSPPEICRYPEKMPWLDVGDAFFSPAELCSKSLALLIGSCMPVVDIIPENLLVEFGVISKPPLENVVEQLSKAVQLSCTDPDMRTTSQFRDLILAIYQHLADVPHDLLLSALTHADLKQWIWHGAGFASPVHVAIERFSIDLHPHLFCLPDYLHQNKALEEFFVSNGVQKKFSKQDIVSVLSSVKGTHENDSSKTAEEIKHDLELCRYIVEWLVEGGEELSADLQENVMVPIQTNEKKLVLKPCVHCTYFDHDWLRQGGSELDIPEEFFLIDDSISEKVASLLGVKPLSTCLLSGEELDFELTGQHEPLTTRLKNILSDYKQGVGVFKELVQNADDAGATKVCFLIDWREGPKKSLFSPSMSECQGPALWAYNDAVFSDGDFKNINKLAGKTKIEDFEKIGRFGLGFNAVYHLTDVPSFLSRHYLVIFDPNIQHLREKITGAQPGLRVNLAKNSRPLKTFSDQFQPYHDVFQCSTSPQNEERFNFNGTLFRFPFRTELQASRSKISEEVYNPEKVKELVDSLKESLSLLLLYTQSVNEVEVYELDKNQNPRSMCLILSTKKSVESVNLELNPILSQDPCERTIDGIKSSFIKECSEWWKTKMSKAAVSPDPSRSEMITIKVKEQGAEEKKEQWLVSSCVGTDSSLQLAMNEGQKDGLLPCAGAAAKLSSDATPTPESIKGEAFCFLPLSIATELPVHVNSSFAVMNNRRNIWERSTTQHQDLEVRWNQSLMSDPLCHAYIQLLENMKSLCEKNVLENYPFHLLWPRKLSSTWETLVRNIYTRIVEDSLQLLRSNGKWLDINSGYVLADNLREAPNVTETMQCLKKNVFELPQDVCATFKECGQIEILEERTLSLEKFFALFFLPNLLELSHELRNPLVLFGLDCILAENEELQSLFMEYSCIPCSEDGNTFAKPAELINPNGDAAELFSLEENRFPVGDEFLTAKRVFALEKLGMKKDLLSWEEIYERARTVEILAKTCYNKALLRSRKLVEYLNKHLPPIQEEKTIQDICFLPFIKEPPQDYKNGLPWKGLERKKEQFCSSKELFVPRYIDYVGSCCLILSTHEELGCGKLEGAVKKFLGMLHQHPSTQQVLEQLDNVIRAWSTFKEENIREKNSANVLKICHCVYECLDKYFAKMAKDNKEMEEGEEMKEGVKELLNELAKRKWLFIDDTFVSSNQVARKWSKSGSPYLYGVPPEYNTRYKDLLLMTNVKEMFDPKDFLDTINLLKKSKGCTPLSDKELDVAVTFLNELENAGYEFCNENSAHFYLPDKSKVLVKADALTINNTPWLPERCDSHSVHEKITPVLAFKLGAKSLFDKRIGKYSKKLGTPFGQQEKLTDRLKSILKSYPFDSGILKELVQNADDAQATEIHFIYDKRTLPFKRVLQKNAEEILGPALCVYNNQAFSESDFLGIQKLGIGSKSEDAEKTGQFGIGFNAVYHLTDCPSFISNGETFCVLDPHCRYAPNARYQYPGERFDSIDQEFRDDFADMITGYLENFGFILHGSTMFRLPLRSVERSRESQISNRAAVYSISSLLDEFKGEAKRSMLFLNHIKRITISEIDSAGKFETKYEVTSNVDGKDMEKLEMLLSHKSSPTNIPWKGVTFPLVLGDTDGCVEHWLVHQCFGVDISDESDEIPDGRDDKLLPHGGLAALVESNQRRSVYAEAPRYFAYCFLPLPVRTPLPVHVNGHFALDSGRRDLWKDADSKDPLALWNTVVMKNVLAPGYASLILEAQKYMRSCEREGEHKTSYFFPGKLSAEAGLSWYHNLFPSVSDESWSPLTLALYKFLAKRKELVLPIVISDEPKENKRPDDMPRRIQRWFPVQDVFFVNDSANPNNPTVSDNLMKILLEIQLPVAGHTPSSVQHGFEKAGYVPRVVSPDSVVLALRDFSSNNAECKIGSLPCNIQDTTIGSESKLGKLISYCKKGKNFLECLPGLPLLLTADSVLRVFSQEEKAYCSTFGDLFPKRAHKLVHPDIVPYLSSVLNKSASKEPSGDSPSDSTAGPNFPTVLLPLTADVVDTFLPDIFPQHTKDVQIHLDFDAAGISGEWLKRLWVYLQTYSKKVDDSKSPLEALKSWPIVPTVSKKLVTVKMAKTVIDMTLIGNEGNAALNVRESLKKLKCPCLDTNVTLPKKESPKTAIGAAISAVSSYLFTRQPVSTKEERLMAVTESYVAHPYCVPDILDVFDFMLKTNSMNADALSADNITEILQFIQGGYENLEAKEKYNNILKQLPFYKSINGKHYKLSEFSEYAVIPADVPAEEIDKLQDHTRCLFLHSDMLQSLETLLNALDAGAKRSNADFYKSYILPNFTIFSDEMQLQYLTHIRDKVIPDFYDDVEAKEEFLNHLKRTRCIPNKNGEYVHASDFYDPRNKVLRIMEEESSNKFPPPPFNETKWLNFLVLIGMTKDVNGPLFLKFASRVATRGNSSPADEKNRKRSKVLLNFLFTNHHLHSPQILQDLSIVKFIASRKVEEVYLSLHEQYCVAESSDHPPYVQFSNAVLWKYRSLVWTSANLIPEWEEVSYICNQYTECEIKDIYKNLNVKNPSPQMVISHLQNIAGVLTESSNKEEKLPQTVNLTRIMNNIYEFLNKARKCPTQEISAECTDICTMIGNRLASTQCILAPADEPKAIVKGDQLSFQIPADKSLVPFIYPVPREYGNLQHLLKRLGATETITPMQLVSVFKKMKDRTRDNMMNPEIKNKAHNAMFLLFESVLKETEKKESSITGVRELYLPSIDNKLIRSNELLCKIPPRHIETIRRLEYRALCLFQTCGLQRELESKYLASLPAILRPKPFQDVVKETLDESCLKKPCQHCEKNDCEFIEKLKVLLKSEQFKNGIIRLLKHQKNSDKLSSGDEEVASRFFLNKVEFKCMERVLIHLLFVETNEVLEGSTTSRKCFVVEDPHNDMWTLYVQHDEKPSNLAKFINKILDWKIRDDLLLAVVGMLGCSIPLEIPGVLSGNDIKIDAGSDEDVKLGSEVPRVFHQLLQQNPLFVFHEGERVAYCAKLPDEADVDGGSEYILAEIIRCVTSNPAEGAYDLEARYLIDIGDEQIEVSVLDLYKFYQDYPDENSCQELVPFRGDVAKKPESYDEAKQEILEALRAAWRLPLELRRKAIHRLYLRWHPDKNPDNPEFAAEMMKFLLEQIERMKKEEQGLAEKPENFDFGEMFERCNMRASRDRATFYNYQRHCPHSSSGFRFDSAMFEGAETYTTPNPREARRWVEQAEGDLSACQYLRTKPFDAMACFTSQQIVEKCLKAALYYECGLTSEQLHTHEIRSLVRCVDNLTRWENNEVVRLALAVCDYYLPTRYPNRLPYPMVPHNSFGGKSCDASSSAAEVLRLVKEFMRN